MIHTVFIDQALELARKANTGTELPSVGLKIRTAQTIAFAFTASGTVGAVAGWVSGKAVIKEKPTSPVLLIDATLDAGGTGEDTRYNAVWTAETLDGPTDGALRQFIADETQPKECWCEVEWIDAAGTHSVSFPITLIPTFNDPEDEAPDPAVAASWDWLKARLAAGDNVNLAINNETKIITISVPDFADGKSVEMQASGTHIQWRLVGDTEWIDLIAISAITGPAGDSGAAGANGASAYEIAVSNGFVGNEAAWLASLIGAAGADGADGTSAYEVAVANGFVGDEAAWLASLVGATGAAGTTGATGAAGSDATAKINIQAFTGNGTWTKPAGAYGVAEVLMYGGGGGGGSGRSDAAGTARWGGGAGGAGAMVKAHLAVSSLSGTEAVVVGDGGNGGAAVQGTSNGNSGINGGVSSFAGYLCLGGNAGTGGQGGTGGTGGIAKTNAVMFYQTSPVSSLAGAAGGSTVGATAVTSPNRLPTGGGGGAGVNVANASFAGGAGGSQGVATIGVTSGGAAGTSGGGAGGIGQGKSDAGQGGGGGGSDGTGASPGGAGGDGTVYGGGGGGGAAGVSAVGSGAGGKGGDGYVIVFTPIA